MTKFNKVVALTLALVGMGSAVFALAQSRGFASTKDPWSAAADPDQPLVDFLWPENLTDTNLLMLPAPAPESTSPAEPLVLRPIQETPPEIVPNAPDPVVETVSVSVLDERRRFALGMIETGNDDDEVGRAGEVSRYQIMPSVWKAYSDSRHYTNPKVSLQVAQQHWTVLYERFKRQAGREPTDFDMYVLWNTRYGYYARKGFSPERLHPVIRDRAQRFVNLVNLSPS